MSADFAALAFSPADLLLPQNCEYDKWSVVACDQYDSQPEYWQRVEEYVGTSPSSLRLIMPESCMDGPNVETDIMDLNNTMTRYLREEHFAPLPQSLIYVERRLDNLRVRRGLVGKIDLEQYDYESGSMGQIRATERILPARLSHRIPVRKNAPMELSHAVLLTDDPEWTVLGPLALGKGEMEPLYRFNLMERGGHISGWRLTETQQAAVAAALSRLVDPAAFSARYGAGVPFLFAVADGNYSLATAKECYERQKKLTAQEHWQTLPSRYAMVEIMNLHDSAVSLEPIHRVVVGVEPETLIHAFLSAFPGAVRGEDEGQVFRYIHAGGRGSITVPNAPYTLEVGLLQAFLRDYTRAKGGRIVYSYDGEEARAMAERPGSVTFLLPALEKAQLFPTLNKDGGLPLKTFTMGKSHDKRFYLEARRIRD